MKKTGKILALFLCFILLASVAVGCGGGSDEGATTDEGDSKDVLIVGTSPDYPPFEFVDENGDFVGFDMDLIKEVGERLGVEVKIEGLEFESLIASLKQGKIDAIISCMSPNEERLQEADFTIPYYRTKHGVLTKPDAGISDLDDVLEDEFGVQTGTTMDAWATSLLEEGLIEESQIKRYSDANAGVLDVKNGRIAAFVIDLPVAYEKAKELDLEVAVETSLTGEDEDPGIVLPKGSDKMIEKLNAIIEEMKEDGTIEELEEKWLRQ